MATLKNLKPDQILYKVRKEKAGRTTMTRQVIDTLRIISVDLEHEVVVARYVGRECKYREHQLKSWRVKEPQVKRWSDILGNPRY
jgi:predicted transcriptional regulator